MAQFDVYRLADAYAVDCQADVLRHYDTRLVIPLRPPAKAPLAAARLNPIFTLHGEDLVLVTQFAGSVPLRRLGERTGSLIAHEYEIKDALDLLISGF
jgi:toxin CcdB